MPNRDLLLRILGDTSSYERATNRASASSKQLEKHVAGLEAPIKRTHTALLNMATGLIGAGGVVFGLESMVKAAKDAEESQGHLNVTMRDAGLSYDANKASIEGVIAKQSELAGFQKTDLRESYAALIRQSKDVGQANSDLALTVDIARGRHIDLAAAQNIVIKANIGMVGALKRMGIEIQPVHDAVNALTDSHLRFTTAQKDAAKALDLAATKQAAIAALQKTYGGQAEEYGKSSAGAADRFKVSLNNLEVTLGTALLPTLTDGLKHVTDWVNKLNDSGDAAKYAHDGVKIVKDVIRDATPIVKGGAAAFEELSHMLGGDAKAVEALGGAFATWKLAGTLGALGSSAGKAGAAGKVAELTRNLKMLAAIGAIGVEIDIAEKFHLHGVIDQAWIDNLKDLIKSRGKGNFSSKQISFLLGAPGHRGLIGNWLTKEFGGGGDNTGSGGVPGQTDIPTTTTMTSDSVLAAAAPFSNTPYQWGGGHGALPGPTVSSGHGRSGLGLDCSGYARAVLANMGISVSGTADGLLGSAKSHPSVNQLQPGDLVFYEGKHPNHVMVYIGNGQVIGETHTGASGPEIKPVAYLPITGTGRYVATEKPGTGGGGGGAPDTTPTTPPKSVQDILDKGTSKKHKAPALTGTHLLSKNTQLALARALGTTGTADDLSALEAARAELVKLPQTVAVATELARVEKQIHAIQQTDLKKHLAIQAAQWKKNAADLKAALKTQDADWKAHVAQLQAGADAAKAVFDRTFGEASNLLLKKEDRVTQMGLASLVVAQTPEEKALADFVAKRAAADLAKSRTDQLANAQTDDERAALALGFSLDDQQVALQAAAEASRVAQDKKTADAQQAFQDQRDLDRQALQDWLDDQKTKLDDGREAWSTFYTDLQKKARDGGWSTGTAFWDAWQRAGVDAASAHKTEVAAGNGFTPFAAGGFQGFVDNNNVPASAGFYGFDSSGKWTGPGLADGGRVLKTGLAMVHEGERYDGGRGFGGDLHVHVNGDVIGVENLVDRIHAGLLRKQQATRLGFKAS